MEPPAATDDAPPLVVTGLACRFRAAPFAPPLEALGGVSFVLGAGRVLGLVGPNGSGKTTLIRCALGLTRPTAGEARVFGARRRRGLPRHVGFAPERFEPAQRRTGRATLRLLGRLAGLRGPDLERGVDAILERMGLAGAAARRVGTWSKGMKRRLAIGAALLHEPRLLVLDEPFDGLDPLGVALVRDEVRSRAAAGMATLLSSHALAEVESVATDLLVLDRGRAVAQGPLEDVLGVRGRVALVVDGLDRDGVAGLEEDVRARGGVVRERRAARVSLEELFRRDTPGGGA